jgi:transposase
VGGANLIYLNKLGLRARRIIRWRAQKTLTEVIIVFELERQIERLRELRQLTRQLQAEAEQIRSTLSKIVESVGGKLVVGSYVLSLSDVMTVPYAKVLSALKESHPELSAEIDELVKQFQTVARRLDIAEKQS